MAHSHSRRPAVVACAADWPQEWSPGLEQAGRQKGGGGVFRSSLPCSTWMFLPHSLPVAAALCSKCHARACRSGVLQGRPRSTKALMDDKEIRNGTKNKQARPEGPSLAPAGRFQSTGGSRVAGSRRLEPQGCMGQRRSLVKERRRVFVVVVEGRGSIGGRQGERGAAPRRGSADRNPRGRRRGGQPGWPQEGVVGFLRLLLLRRRRRCGSSEAQARWPGAAAVPVCAASPRATSRLLNRATMSAGPRRGPAKTGWAGRW